MTIPGGSRTAAQVAGIAQRTLVYGVSLVALLGLAMQIGPYPFADAATARASVNASELLPPIGPSEAAPAQGANPSELFELTLSLEAGASLSDLLEQAGIAKADAASAARLVESEMGSDLGDCDAKLALGKRGSELRIERLTILSDTGETLLQRRGDALAVVPPAVGLRRVKAKVEGSVYWSLRAAGLSADLAAEAEGLAARHGGAISGDSVTAVLGARPARFGTRSDPRLVYLKVERGGATKIDLLRWPGAPGGWIGPEENSDDDGLMRPVPGAVTSQFGIRFHPILHFLRLHRGLDFSASWGEPVRAAADGIVTGAGWHGGYGRQVRLDHGAALGTSYSHLSSIAVRPGERVAKGEVIGLAGASGLATGPHLHFEVYRDGRQIDPRSASLDGASAISPVDRQAIEARRLQMSAAPAA